MKSMTITEPTDRTYRRRLDALDRANVTWGGMQPGDIAILRTAKKYEQFLLTGEYEEPTTGVRIARERDHIVDPDAPRPSSWPR